MPSTATTETLVHVQVCARLNALIETDGVEVAGGDFIALCMKAAAQMRTDLTSKCLALKWLAMFC